MQMIQQKIILKSVFQKNKVESGGERKVYLKDQGIQKNKVFIVEKRWWDQLVEFTFGDSD